MSGTTSLPSSFAFAFTLVLISSKPHGVTIEDYVLALRKSASPVLNASVVNPSLIRHSELWRHLFDLNLQRNLHLQGAIETQNSKRQDHTDDEPVDKLAGRKRKCNNASRVRSQANNRLKRQRLSPSSEVVTENQHGDRKLILQAIFQLNRIVREPDPNLADFTSSISTACDAVLRICKNVESTKIADRSGKSQMNKLSEACQAAEQVWTAIISSLEATNGRTRTILRLSALAVPISSVVRFFLDELCLHCLEEARRKYMNSSGFSPLKIVDTKRQSGNNDDSDQLEGFRYNSNIITCSLIYMMSTAARLYTEHYEIYEAIASVYLQHVGKIMAIQLFGDPNDSCAIQYVAPLPGLSSASGICLSNSKSAAQLEAPYLVKILRPFVQTTMPESLGPTNSNLVANLQKYLLQGLFGNEDGQNQAWTNTVETLDPGIAHGIDIQPPHDEKDEYWFLTQVWEVLGWDVLIG